MKTTVMLRDDIREMLISRFGKRGLSRAINDLLFEHVVLEKRQTMFGADPWLAKTKGDLRDHEDRDV